jgi:hypothetical protein
LCTLVSSDFNCYMDMLRDKEGCIILYFIILILYGKVTYNKRNKQIKSELFS